MKLLALLILLSFTLQPSFAADPNKPDPNKPKTAREKREEEKKKEEDKKKAEEKKKEDEKKKREEKRNPVPVKPVPPSGPPPKKEKTDMLDEDAVALLKPYDTNGDYEIDVDEFKAVQADFKKNPKGPLKAFDKGKDGVLDAMIDRTAMNVKLGSAAPKTKPLPPAPAPVKKTEPPKPSAPAPAPAPSDKPADKKP